MYFSCLVPYVHEEFQTEWHPGESYGPFCVLTRGAFKTENDAVRWAREHLNGTPYRVVKYDENEVTETFTPA